MSHGQEKPATWGRFLSGCALLLVMFGGLAFGLYTLATKESPLTPVVREKVLDPYFAALGTEQFLKTCRTLSDPKRFDKVSPEEMAASFQSFSAEYGALGETEIKALNRETVIGDERSWLVVKVLMHFEKGRTLPATYRILDKEWLILSSSTSDRGVDIIW